MFRPFIVIKVVEILFARGLVKVLFATETFAMVVILILTAYDSFTVYL